MGRIETKVTGRHVFEQLSKIFPLEFRWKHYEVSKAFGISGKERMKDTVIVKMIAGIRILPHSSPRAVCGSVFFRQQAVESTLMDMV